MYFGPEIALIAGSHRKFRKMKKSEIEWFYGAVFARLAGLGEAESIQPREAPKTKKHISVSQKWLRATLRGMIELGRSSTSVQTDRKAAMAITLSHLDVRSMRTSGKTQAK